MHACSYLCACISSAPAAVGHSVEILKLHNSPAQLSHFNDQKVIENDDQEDLVAAGHSSAELAASTDADTYSDSEVSGDSELSGNSELSGMHVHV